MTTRENLSPLSLPTSADGWEGWIGSRCDDELDRARAVVDGLKSGGLGGSADILDSWNEVNLALRNAFAVASLMSQVHPDEARRTQAENAEQEAQKFSTDLMLDHEVYDLLASVDPEPLDVQARRMLDLALRDYRRAGVDRDELVRRGAGRAALVRGAFRRERVDRPGWEALRSAGSRERAPEQ